MQKWTGLGLAVVLPLLPLGALPARAQETNTQLQGEQVIEGRFGEGSRPFGSDRLAQGHQFQGRSGDRITIELVSDAFGPALGLIYGEESIAIDRDEAGTGKSSRIAVELPATGTYTVITIGKPGSYRLTWRPATAAELELFALQSLDQQAAQLAAQGEIAAAIPLFEQTLATRQRLLGNHLDVVESLNALAVLHEAQGSFAEAKSLSQQALEMARLLYEGRDHPAIAVSLNNLAGTYQAAGKFRAAEPLARRALEMHQRLQAPADHPSIATSANNLATILQAQGKYEAAEPLLQQVLKMVRRLHAEADHTEVAASLNNLAALRSAQGQYVEAESLYRQALAMNQRLHEGEHPSVAKSLNNLAYLQSEQGRYAEAEPLFQTALEILQRFYPPEHPDIAASLNNLASVYRARGRYAEAEALYQQILERKQRLYGEGDHPDIARTLNNLASLYGDRGEYGEAETMYREALAMLRRSQGGSDHPDVAAYSNNLAFLYREQGRYAEAASLYQQALKMQRRLYSADHASVAVSLNNLANLHSDRGRPEKAEPLYQEALDILQRLHPGDHPLIATGLTNLAYEYQERGRLEAAAPLYQRALVMRQRLYSGDHPDLANSFAHLAALHQIQGQFAEAESFSTRALVMNRRLYGENHPAAALSLSNLAFLYKAKKDYPQALKLSIEAAAREEAILAKNLRIGSERQKRQFLDLFQDRTDGTISFHLQMVPADPEAARLALTTILQRKGRVLDAMGQALQTLRDRLDPESQELFARLASAQTQLANLSSRPLPADTIARDRALAERTRLDGEIRRLEGELSDRSAEFRQEAAPVSLDAVRAAIPSDGALVEFIQYRPFNATATPGVRFGSPRYAAYALLPDGTLRWHDLGEAAPIDARVDRFRRALSRNEPRFGGVSADALKATARDLDRLLMAPVREMTGSATHLLLSPDSTLNLLPFAALVDAEGQYLVQNYHITYLTSGRDLLRTSYRAEALQPPLILANPTFDTPGTLSAAVSPGSDRGDRGDRRSMDLAKVAALPALPGTKVEGEAIAGLLPDLTLLVEAEASENSLKRWQQPKILHLATHGFFLKPSSSNDPDERARLDRENPLLRSGLALAGFNQRQSEGEDGALTALEVTGLNLRGTRLVVLSACETGLGDVAAGEGVYGLRRAFTLAGAESQLMSLWSVSDRGTQELMVAYYQRLQAGEGRGEALRQVQLDMLQSENRAHPFFWAAFIPVGAWSPLD